MSKTKILDKTKLELWVKTGGRCEYPGCNQILWRDGVTLAKMNASYIAHIISDSPKGPRGHVTLSKKLDKAFSNLMLMCDKHHRLIDKEQLKQHPAELLRAFKKEHEERIEWLTGLTSKRKTHVLSFSANIGEKKPNHDFEKICEAVLSNKKYPASNPGIEIDLTKTDAKDHERNYWKNAQQEITRQVKAGLSQKYGGESVKHLSIFALSPIPLLIQLGAEVGDIRPADIYQYHRSSDNWVWSGKMPRSFRYVIKKPSAPRKGVPVVLNLSLSGTIHEQEISKAIPGEIDTYSLTIPNPHRDFLKSKSQLKLFKHEICALLQEIRQSYGPSVQINIFPAVPASIAVEIGRCLLPKTDPKIHVYDHNKKTKGFKKTITIK